MAALTFEAARETVVREVRARRNVPAVEHVALEAADSRVLAVDAAADRDYPPFHRATRDGFAVRAADLPGTLRVIGEARAGHEFAGSLGPGECVEIMTGAPAPAGADAVIMIEHVTRPSSGEMATDRTMAAGDNIAPAGCEARAGAAILAQGTRLDYSHIAWLATVGMTAVPVYRRPRVAILATGDEIVAVDAAPGPNQIRNSNSYALAAQVRLAGGEAVILPAAPDDRAATAALLRRGFECDLLLISGGVSAGKYDFVEAALADCGAVFHFDRVLIQPGQPLVFGHAEVGGVTKFFFGLPGNPASTMVTFELFGRAALELLAGQNEAPLPFATARLAEPFRHKTGLTRFLPAMVREGRLTPLKWQGSGDVPSICRANAYLVAGAEKPEYAEGDPIQVLLKQA